MPNISNVQLQIQKTPFQQAPTASRTVTVDSQVTFNQGEVNARANFQVRVSLLSNDNEVLPITTFNLTQQLAQFQERRPRPSSDGNWMRNVISSLFLTSKGILTVLPKKCQMSGGLELWLLKSQNPSSEMQPPSPVQ